MRGGHIQSCLPFLPVSAHPGSRLKTENFPQNPRNITFYILKPRRTITIAPIANPRGGRARHSVRAAIGIQADKLSWLPLSHRFTFKKNIMQVTFCKPVTLAAKAPKMPGRVATGFPLPSTGRGIEGGLWVRGGHIQSCLPSVSSCISTTRRPS